MEPKIFDTKFVNTAFLSRKWVNMVFLLHIRHFLSQYFVNTRSSIAFKDILRSSIAPQVVLLCINLIIFLIQCSTLFLPLPIWNLRQTLLQVLFVRSGRKFTCIPMSNIAKIIIMIISKIHDYYWDHSTFIIMIMRKA